MDQSQQPQPPVQPFAPQPAGPQPVAPPAPVAVQSGQPRNFLAVMALATFTGPFGFSRIYTGQKAQGWIRFGLYVGGLLTSFILIGILPFFVALIWGVVDFFVIYLGKHVDAEGQPFVATDRDKKAAKLLFIGTIVVAVLYIVFVIGALALGVFAGLTSHGSSTSINSGSSY